MGEHISLGICFSWVGEHITKNACFLCVGDISLEICFTLVGEHVSKGISVSLVRKHLSLGQFFKFFCNIGQENAFYDILERKNNFVGYKNNNFKKSKN